MAKTIWVCKTCGSDQVFSDAFVNMNDPTDVRTYDQKHCDKCEGETSVVTRSEYEREHQDMTRARAIGEEIAEQEKQSDIVNSADESSELIEWQKQLLEELRDMGFDDPDQSIDGGDAVEYLGKLYVDLKEMVES